MIMDSLALQSFVILRDLFFDERGKPALFHLREKLNTQDDPFDEFIANALDEQLQKIGSRCQKASGPLISPDMVVYKQGIDLNHASTENNPSRVIGVEVKKLERGKTGKIARSTGLDFNTTPPCGKIRIYTESDSELVIKGYYLFACLERNEEGLYYVSAMSLCDGSILNDDYDLYTEITGSREKEINLGTYGDGANRNRPMLIFSNPLGADILDHKITLITELALSAESGNIDLAWRFIRTDINNNRHQFYVYMDKRDINPDHVVEKITEPFPKPTRRVEQTQSRGKFKLIIR
jgi:hypothetical protein